jgi:Bacterial alpha-L-rhamnosidase 6 hairpin glycosidase domain/Bacterial alpha-L-rhamnosidase C-terminal domain
MACVSGEPTPESPRPGEWQKYVLTPTARVIRPIKIISTDEQGGVILGASGFLNGQATLVLKKNTADSDPRVVLDFGLEVGGFLEADFTAAGATTLFAFSESLAGMGDWGDTFGAIAPSSVEDRLKPQRERRFESPHEYTPNARASWSDPVIRGGFRYVMIRLAPEAPAGATVSLEAIRLRFTPLPGVNLSDHEALYKGRFLSSDDGWNRIWYAGAYTLQLATIDPNQGTETGAERIGTGARVFVDGAKRDRLIWNGDLAITGRIDAVTTNDQQAMRDSLRSIAAHQDADGFLSSCSPVGRAAALCTELLEYHLWWLIALGEYHLNTGDTAFAQELWSTVTRAMQYLSKRSLNSSHPPLLDLDRGGKQGHWLYGDAGLSTYLNALYVRTLELTAQLASTIGQNDEARAWRSTIPELRAAINATLWDEAAGAYRQSSFQPGNIPEDGNAMMSLFAIAPPEHAARSLETIKQQLWTPHGSKTGTGTMPALIGPFMNYWEILARFQAGQDDDAWELMRRVWRPMILETHGAGDTSTTTWEHINPDGTPFNWNYSGPSDGSQAHPWSAGVTALLTNQVLGVYPTSPGYARYAIKPHPGKLKWAEGQVPTPHGFIKLDWQHQDQDFTLHLQAPPESVGTVSLPTFGCSVKVWADERLVWDGARGSTGTARLSSDARFVTIENILSGTHVFRVQEK